MVATTTALLIGAGIAAGGQVAGAYMASRGAKKAGEIQAGAANEAKAELRPIYDANVARMQPYAERGQQAVGSLGDLMGFPALSATGSPPAPLGPIDGRQGPMNMSDPRVRNLVAGGSLADPGMSQVGTIGAATRSSYGGPSIGTAVSRGGMVTLQAPTGETGQFPEEQAEQFIARGAKRVG